jgi:hypothetical protein
VFWTAQEVFACNSFLIYLLTLSTDKIIWHEMIKISEYGTGKMFKWLRPNLRYYFGIFLEWQKKTTKCFRQDDWSLGLDLNKKKNLLNIKKGC